MTINSNGGVFPTTAHGIWMKCRDFPRRKYSTEGNLESNNWIGANQTVFLMGRRKTHVKACICRWFWSELKMKSSVPTFQKWWVAGIHNGAIWQCNCALIYSARYSLLHLFPVVIPVLLFFLLNRLWAVSDCFFCTHNNIPVTIHLKLYSIQVNTCIAYT